MSDKTGVRALPPRPLGRAEPGEHPRLLFTRDELSWLRAAKATGYHATVWANVVASAEWCLSRPVRSEWIAPRQPDPIYENLYDRFYAMMHDMAIAEHLAITAAISGEERFIAPAKAWAIALATVWSMEAEGQADASKAYAVTRVLKAMAVAYDVLHDRFTAEELTLLRGTLAAITEKYHAFFANPVNNFGPGYEPHHGSIEAGTMGFVAIALSGEDPRAQTWLDFFTERHVNWLLPQALTASGTHNQTSTFWVSIMHYRIAFMDAMRRCTGRDMFTEFKQYMPWNVPLACVVGKRRPVYPYGNESWLYGGNSDETATLTAMAREYRSTTLQHLATRDEAPGSLLRTRYVSRAGDTMLFSWGAYAFLWYDPTLPAAVEPGLPRSFLFLDPDPKNDVTSVAEAYARASYELGGLCVGVRRGCVAVHAGGKLALCTHVPPPGWPPPPATPDMALSDLGSTAAIEWMQTESNQSLTQRVTLHRPGRVVMERRTALPWTCYAQGSPTHHNNTLTWPSGVRLNVTRGNISAFDSAGYTEPIVVGLGKLPLEDPAPASFPLFTFSPENGHIVVEILNTT